jgi:hypothetical protein
MTLKAVDTQPDQVDPGPLTFNAPCPACGVVVYFPIELGARLTMDEGGAKLRPHMSSKSVEHRCGDPAQPALAFGDPDE